MNYGPNVLSIVIDSEEAKTKDLMTTFLSFLVGKSKKITFIFEKEAPISLKKGGNNLQIESPGEKMKVTGIEIDNSGIVTKVKDENLLGLAIMLLVKGDKIISFRTKKWHSAISFTIPE